MSLEIIQDDKRMGEKTFGSLEPGSMFSHGDGIYMKSYCVVDGESGTRRAFEAFCFDTGYMCHCDESTLVNPVIAKLNWRYK